MKWRALHFLPLAFLAGTHGFALFAPYAALVLAALHVRGRRSARRSAPVEPAAEPLPV